MNNFSTIYTSAPSPEGRSERENRTYRLLDDLKIKYERVDHRRTASIEACHEVENILGISICKNLFLCNSQKTKFYLLVMPGEKPFKTKDVSKQINSPRLSFAPEEYLLELLDIQPGSVSILGLMNDKDNKVSLLVDRDVAECEYFGCHPCENSSSLKIKWTDIQNVFLPCVHHSITFVEIQK